VLSCSTWSRPQCCLQYSWPGTTGPRLVRRSPAPL